MIRLELAGSRLYPAERFGWEILLDASQLLGAEGLLSGGVGADLVTVRCPDASNASSWASGVTDPLTVLIRAFEVSDGCVVVRRALLRALAEVAGGVVEQRSEDHDRHGRVPSTTNPLVVAGRERQPLVSETGLRFRAAVRQAAGRRPMLSVAPWPGGHRWAAAFSHDLDVVAAWPVFTALRLVELTRKGQTGALASVVAAAIVQAGRNPVSRGVQEVLAVERRAGIGSTWFVLCGTPTMATFRCGDLTYRPESRRARAIVDAVRGAGHEVALHGSFATMDHPAEFGAQRARLGRVAGTVPTGVRQHFLRMRPGETQGAMAAAGFTYDATYGFPDRNGFRLGVADVVPAWNAATSMPTGLDEVPLIWMDRAQSKYQHIEDPARWIDDALDLAAVSRAVDGLWVGLWHPNLTPALGFPGAPEAYARLVTSIVEREPYVAPLEQIVQWRRLRRAVRTVDPGTGEQAVSVSAPSSRAFEITILDDDGRVVATLPRADREGVPDTVVRIPLS